MLFSVSVTAVFTIYKKKNGLIIDNVTQELNSSTQQQVERINPKELLHVHVELKRRLNVQTFLSRKSNNFPQ